MHHVGAQARDAKGRFMKAVPTDLDPVQLLGEAPLLEAPPVNFGQNYRTSQIYSQGFEFAFMSNIDGTYQQACTFVYCKDFLHDAVWAMVNKTSWSIYSFKYNSAKDVPLDMNNCVFAFRNTLYKGKEAEFHGKLAACQEFLNKFEAKVGFEPSRVYEVPYDTGPCWLIIGDKAWQHAPPLVGLYTLLIRVGYMHTPGDSADDTLEKAKSGKIKIGSDNSYAGHRDCSYISQAWKGIQVVMKHGLKVFHDTIEENYPENVRNIGPSLHDCYGPVNFSKGSPRKAMPYWYRDEIWK